METTLNIHIDILAAITRAAQYKGVSRSEIIIILIKKVMDSVSSPARYGRLVLYQKRCMLDSWRTFHVQLREDDYEYLLDLRKLLKMSVSCILAYAVKKYLKQPLDRISTDNYRYKNYVIIKNIKDGIIYWILIWGYPPNIHQFMPK